MRCAQQIAVLLLGVTLAAMLSGCGKKDDETKSENETTNGQDKCTAEEQKKKDAKLAHFEKAEELEKLKAAVVALHKKVDAKQDPKAETKAVADELKNFEIEKNNWPDCIKGPTKDTLKDAEVCVCEIFTNVYETCAGKSASDEAKTRAGQCKKTIEEWQPQDKCTDEEQKKKDAKLARIMEEKENLEAAVKTLHKQVEAKQDAKAEMKAVADELNNFEIEEHHWPDCIKGPTNKDTLRGESACVCEVFLNVYETCAGESATDEAVGLATVCKMVWKAILENEQPQDMAASILTDADESAERGIMDDSAESLGLGAKAFYMALGATIMSAACLARRGRQNARDAKVTGASNDVIELSATVA